MAFVLWLCALEQLGLFTPADYLPLALDVFEGYYLPIPHSLINIVISMLME
jgi:hypothetical protein